MSSKLYVGNISWSTDQEGLKEAFSQYGEVVDAFIAKDKFSGRSRGFGFVTMGDDAQAQAAIEGLHEKELDGRQLIVNEARPQEPRN